MKRFLFLLISLIAVLTSLADERPVYILDFNDEVGSTTWNYTRNAIKEAKDRDARMLVVHLNTYGGTVLHADSIHSALLHLDMPVVAFVDNNAASAGALIALACDSVYMRPDATMGAATVVNGNDGQAMPDKYQSYMRAMMRATAEHHGRIFSADSTWRWRRDPRIAEAMVDPSLSVPGIIEKGKVLTLTATEAVRHGYAEGTAESLGQVLEELNVADAPRITYSPTWIDHLMGFFTNPAVQSLLIMLIIGGIYFELQTPGMGFPSVVAIAAAALYFLPMYLTGIVSSWIVLLFLAGFILLLFEIFVVPGFGITGIAGIVLMVVSVFMGLLDNFSFYPGHIDFSGLGHALATFMAGCLLATGLIFYLMSRFAPKFVQRSTALTREQRIEDGYIGVDTSVAVYIGREGIAVTPLRPSGKIEIDSEQFDAVSTRGFIEEGTPVKVIRHENAQLYVTAAG